MNLKDNINLTIHNFLNENFISEATSDMKTLYPNVKKNETVPALLTWNEYYNILNEYDKSHPSSAYNNSYDETKKFICRDECKIIKNMKVGNLLLKFYEIKRDVKYAKFDGEKYVGVFSDDEVIKMGHKPYQYEYTCTHNEVVVGEAQDELGCILVSVVKEYRRLGIGEQLMKLYLNKYPYKPSGGVTASGYNELKRYYNWMVSNTLANGVYSEMVRRGELTMDRVKEILKSANLKDKFSYEKKNPLKDIYKSDEEKPIYIINDNSVVIFDADILNLYKNDYDEIPDTFIKKYIYCYIHLTDYNGYLQVYDLYGDEKYIHQGLYILLNVNKEQGGIGDYYFRNFDTETKKILQNFWNSDLVTKKIFKKKGYIDSVPLTVISSRSNIMSLVNSLNSKSKKWFKENDKHDELYNYIIELAYGMTM